MSSKKKSKLKGTKSKKRQSIKNENHLNISKEDSSSINVEEQDGLSGNDTYDEFETIVRPDDTLIRYDEDLFDRSRTQWQFGDWESLTELTAGEIQHDPNCDKLALLAAAGHQQTGNTGQAKKFIHLAQSWGASKRQVSQTLVAGVLNTLGRAAALAGHSEKALKYFEEAIETLTPGSDVQLLKEARTRKQLAMLGLNINQSKEIFYDPNLNTPGSHQALLSRVANQDIIDKDCMPVFRLDARNLSSDIKSIIKFYSNQLEEFTWDEDGVTFDVHSGHALYLVTQPSGDFHNPPEDNKLPFEAGEVYSMSGKLCVDCPVSPILWFFEYAQNELVNKQSFTCSNGRVEVAFKTRPDSEYFSLGIRLGEKGRLESKKSYLVIRQGAAAEIVYQNKIQSNTGQKVDAEQKKTLKQLENFVRLQAYMGSDFIMPDMHGWPISPDLGVLLIRQIQSEKYDAIIEFGSGVSTLIIAKVIEKLGKAADATTPMFMSFDHLEEYYEQTAVQLELSRLKEIVHLMLAPLVSYEDDDGVSYPYYDCKESLQQLSQRLISGGQSAQLKILILVDGPPEGTGPHARYPALPLTSSVFGSHHQLHILMDDYIRGGEREIVKKWQAWLQGTGYLYQKQEFLSLEKQACLLKIKKEA
jgi:tetratricopeptide (TPR) repeat protein